MREGLLYGALRVGRLSEGQSEGRELLSVTKTYGTLGFGLREDKRILRRFVLRMTMVGALFLGMTMFSGVSDYGAQSAMKMLVSCGALALRFDAQTSFFPSGLNMGKPSKPGL